MHGELNNFYCFKRTWNSRWKIELCESLRARELKRVTVLPTDTHTRSRHTDCIERGTRESHCVTSPRDPQQIFSINPLLPLFEAEWCPPPRLLLANPISLEHTIYQSLLSIIHVYLCRLRINSIQVFVRLNPTWLETA